MCIGRVHSAEETEGEETYLKGRDLEAGGNKTRQGEETEHIVRKYTRKYAVWRLDKKGFIVYPRVLRHTPAVYKSSTTCFGRVT